MQVKLRQHEIVVASLFTGLTAFSYLREAVLLSNVRLIELTETYKEHGAEFSYLFNVLFPQLGVLLCLFGIYIWLNLISIPYFKRTKEKATVAFLLVFIQVVILSLILSLAINAATLFANPSWFNYAGFGMLSFLGYNDTPMENLLQGFGRAATIILIYLCYAILREYVIFKLEHSTNQRNYRILICNQVSTILGIYLLVPVCLYIFRIIGEQSFYNDYFIFATSSIPIYFINTYVVFYQLEESSQHVIWHLLKWLGATLCFSFPLALWFIPGSGTFVNTWMSNWAFQIFVFSPISWFIYIQQKDAINEYRGTYKALAKSTADLQLLRSQINPHFLFNALNNLYGIALLDGSKRTAEGIQKLGDMMRFMLDDNHLDFIPLKSELAYIKNYISIQELRISPEENIKITADFDTDVNNLKVAPMLLMPLVENAFKHGINIDSESWIHIRLNCHDGKSIHFRVANSYNGVVHADPEKHQSGIGIFNVKERLEIFYHGHYVFNHGVIGNEYVSEIFIDSDNIQSN
ncbi:sensor histidine kinase [Pedobacter sp.]|uniref:sensor histidine kinase n=1 Tax=Pedobacter sp. TaxID=1411316 RepID=UPI003D7F73CE